MASKGNPLSPKKSLAFKVFACQNKGKLLERYPFLTDQQIRWKLKNTWRKRVSEEKQQREREKASKKERSLKLGSPLKVSKYHVKVSSTKSCPSEGLQSPDSILISRDPESPSPEIMPLECNEEENGIKEAKNTQPDNLTVETVQAVRSFTLDIEAQKSPRPVEDAATAQQENVVDGLFAKKTDDNRESVAEKTAVRLLASGETEGKSNFNMMFDAECNEFL